MTDMDAIFMALAELAKQNREQAAEIAELKAARRDHHERLNAQAAMIKQLRRPVWRDDKKCFVEEAA